MCPSQMRLLFGFVIGILGVLMVVDGNCQQLNIGTPRSELFLFDKAASDRELHDEYEQASSTSGAVKTAGEETWTLDWSGELIVSDAEFFNPASWTPNVADAGSGDLVSCTTDGASFQMDWTLGSGNRDKWVQCYMVLSTPVSLESSDIIGVDFKGSNILKTNGTDVAGEVDFELKFEDGAAPQAVYSWEQLARLERWADKMVALKKAFGDTESFDWSNITVVSLAVKAGPSEVDVTGTINVKNLQSSLTTNWEKAVTQEFIDPSQATQIKADAISAILSRQTAEGCLTTWTEEENKPAWLYGQGLALKALCLEGTWDQSVPTNASAQAAENLALFLANNQEPEGYWPRAWYSQTGVVMHRLEEDGTVWFGDFPWPLTGLQSYYKKTGDDRVVPAIENALQFLKTHINEEGIVFTENMNTNQFVEVTSCEAYAAVLLSLHESGETTLAAKVWSYIRNAGWDGELHVWKESVGHSRLVLFANTWLAPYLIMNGETQAALDALSLIGKAMNTNGPGTPNGLDGVVPLAVWYEGTLSYIVAGGPGSVELFDNLKPFINEGGTVPHYNDDIGSMAGIWAVDWASLDGTSWLYFAASGNTPFATDSTWRVFSDGFESGDLSKWSATTP